MQKYGRRSIRIPGYDYAQPGTYYWTLITKNRWHLFGEVVHAKVRLSALGCIARAYWREIPKHYPNVALDTFEIMPNHVHGILVVETQVGAQNFEPQRHRYRHTLPKPIGSIIRA